MSDFILSDKDEPMLCHESFPYYLGEPFGVPLCVRKKGHGRSGHESIITTYINPSGHHSVKPETSGVKEIQHFHIIWGEQE